MLFKCELFDNFSIPAANVRFKDHYFLATTPGQIAHLQMPHIKRRGVRPATDEEAAAFFESGRAETLPVSEPAPVTPPAGAEGVKEPAPIDPPADTVRVGEDPASADGEDTPPAGAPTGEAPGGEQVPDGTADDVLAWVGDDAARAAAAVEAEQGREKPRKTLLASLEKLTAAE